VGATEKEGEVVEGNGEGEEQEEEEGEEEVEDAGRFEVGE